MLLTKELILAFDDLKKQLIAVPEWGGDVYIRMMTGNERDAWEEWCARSGASLAGVRARIASLCMVDEAGNRLFQDSDVDLLGKKSGAALERIVAAIQKLNSVTDDDIKDLSKN